MAGETTSDSGSLGTTMPTEIGSELVQETRENTIMAQFAKVVIVKGAVAHSFPRLSTPPSVAAITSGASEMNAQSATTLVAAVSTATIAAKATHVIQSMLTQVTSAVNWVAEMPGIIGRALADLMDVDLAALLGGFSNTVGTSGADATFQNVKAALLKLRTVAKGKAGNGVIVLHPQQADDVDTDLTSGTNSSLATVMSRSDLINWFGGEAGSGVLESYRGSFLNRPCFISTNVPDANAAADHAGAVFIPGETLGMALGWAPTQKQSDQASNLKVGSSWQGSMGYGVVEIFDSYGVSIITDHS